MANFGEVRRAQLAYPLSSSPGCVPGIYLDVLRSVQMLKREWCAQRYRTYSIPGKTAALVPEFAVEDLASAELRHWFLRLQNTLIMNGH